MAPSTKDIAFVLVPGSFSEPVIFERVSSRLVDQGYTVESVRLISAGDRSPEPPGSMYDDAENIRGAVIKLLDTGKDVVIAMSSYGGIPGSEAVKGLSRGERGDGQSAVTGLVYIAALLPPVGMSLNDLGTRDGVPGFPGEGPYMHLDADVIPPLVFSDLPDSEHAEWFKTMTVHSRSSFDDKLTHAGYRHVPSAFILTEADRIVTPDRQHRMVDDANEGVAENRKVEKVLLDSGHAPMLSRPDEVVRVLVDVATRQAR